jgi:acetylornithine deacetylase/succinyl-diaminopimelate desuccinylase
MPFDALAFHEDAVRTPSHEDVTAMRELLVETLAAAGVDSTVDEAGNVLARRGGGGPHLVLNTHIDTVPPHAPYERDGDVVRGRGACDAKGPLAALVDAFLRADVGSGQLTLAITPNEETTQVGAAHLRASLDADGVIVGEPTGLDVCNAARGQFEGTVTIRGTNAHAATPDAGDNAVLAAAPVLEAMDTFDAATGTSAHGTLGEPTLTPTVIAGGDAYNQVPAECTITFDRRSVPPEDSAEFPPRLAEHIGGVVPDGIELAVELAEREAPILEAFQTDRDAAVVRALADASGGDVRPFGAATEASLFAELTPTVVFGPGVLADADGAVAHSDREYVRRTEIEAAADAVRTCVEGLC